MFSGIPPPPPLYSLRDNKDWQCWGENSSQPQNSTLGHCSDSFMRLFRGTTPAPFFHTSLLCSSGTVYLESSEMCFIFVFILCCNRNLAQQFLYLSNLLERTSPDFGQSTTVDQLAKRVINWRLVFWEWFTQCWNMGQWTHKCSQIKAWPGCLLHVIHYTDSSLKLRSILIR